MRPAFLFVAALLPCTSMAAAPTDTPAPSAIAVFARALDPDVEPLASGFETQLARALIDRGLDVADPGARFPPPAPPSLAQGEELIEAGREAYNNLDPDTALAKFNEAATFYASHPAASSPEHLARALLAVGATALLNGDGEAAQDAFRRALLLVPDLEPEYELFGNDVRAAMDEARAWLAEAPTGQIAIRSSPSGARVRVNGKDLGATPLPAQTLPSGRHHVVLERPGYVPFGAFPEVPEGDVAELAPVLEPSPGLAPVLAEAAALIAPEPFARDGLPPGAKALGERVGSRFLVLAAVRKSPAGAAQAEVQAWDLLTGNQLKGLTVDIARDDGGTLEELAGTLQRWVENPPAASGPGLALEAPPLLRKWWFWAAVGGVAAATVGVVAVSQGGGHRPDFVLGLP